MPQQLQRCVISPVQILKYDNTRSKVRRSVNEVAIRIKQGAALLFRRKLHCRRDVGKQPPKFRHEFRHLRRRVPDRVPKRLPWGNPRDVLEGLDEWHVWRRALHLVAMPYYPKAASPRRFLKDCPRQMRLADTGFATN